MSTPESTLKARALDLKLHGLLSHWEAIKDNSWVSDLIQWEEEERARRSLERRLKGARLGRGPVIGDRQGDAHVAPPDFFVDRALRRFWAAAWRSFASLSR